MARSAPVIPVDAKMYRHFAVVTVVITGFLAMFASGENSQAIESRLEAQEQKLAMQQAEQKRLAKKSAAGGSFVDRRSVQGSFGSEVDVSFRQPRPTYQGNGFAMVDQAELVAASSSPSVTRSAAQSGIVVEGAEILPPGMSPQEYAEMKARGRKKKPTESAPSLTAQETAGLLAASEARSRTQGED